MVIYKKFDTYSSEILDRIKKNFGNIPSERWPTFLRVAEKTIGSPNYNLEISQTLSARVPENNITEIANVFNSPLIVKLLSTASTNTDQLANEKDQNTLINKTIEQFKLNGEINERLAIARFIDRDLTFESDLQIKEDIYHEIRNDFGHGVDVFSLDYKKKISVKSLEFMKSKSKIESELMYCTKELSLAEVKNILEILSKPEYKNFFSLIKQTVFNLRNKSEADFLLQYKAMTIKAPPPVN